MSIIGYAAITNSRDASEPGATFTDATDETKSSKKTYIDALAALVPAEVLAAHALVFSYATKTENKVVTITDPDTLGIAFWSLCVVSWILFVVPRGTGGRWQGWDFVRMFIPVLAFVGWTMLQATSAFDAVFTLTQPRRALYAVVLALVLGAVATALAYRIDKKDPPAAKKLNPKGSVSGGDATVFDVLPPSEHHNERLE